MPAQIHGHDFACIAVLSGTSTPCYASGSEEKVIRVLEAPRAYEDTLALGTGAALHASSESRSNGAHKQVRLPLLSCTVILEHPLIHPRESSSHHSLGTSYSILAT